MIIATRRSPLARAQTSLVRSHLAESLPAVETKEETLVTTGDRQLAWSLRTEGGKGLFTAELETALLEGRAHLAVHSAKDLPTEMPAGLAIAGYLAREAPHDVLVLREGLTQPKVIATGSPRRQAQLAILYPDLEFTELRGNVGTRLEKIAKGIAYVSAAEDRTVDGTVLAAAGLRRLGIYSWPGLVFLPLSLRQMVPAPGQAAIAIQTTENLAELLGKHFDAPTAIAIERERRFLGQLGGGCHSAVAAHEGGGRFLAFKEGVGHRQLAREGLSDVEWEAMLASLAEEMQVE